LWVSFEELVSDPDQVQDRLTETLGLTWRARFSDYPSFLPPGWGERDQMHSGHRVRDLESDPTEHVQTIEQICLESRVPREDLESALYFYGYEV
jgi:hypothetical protein